MPDNLPANAVQWTDIHGQAIETDDSGKCISNSIKAGKDFAGLQGQIWSETLRSDDLVEYMTLPKLLIFAEKAWHKAKDGKCLIKTQEKSIIRLQGSSMK